MKPIPYDQLRKEYGRNHISYEALLNTVEWNEKRNKILARDHYSCTVCKKSWTCSFIHNGNQLHLRIRDDDYGMIFQGGFELDSKPYILHIHHNFYVIGRLPWQYDDKDLRTLCNWCHEDLHQHEGITVYDKRGNLVNQLTPCQRCGGQGWFPEFAHVEDGVCFRCWGEKYEELLTSDGNGLQQTQ